MFKEEGDRLKGDLPAIHGLQKTTTLFSGLPEESGVYFIFDVNEVLLYVGETVNIGKRIGRHKYDSPWFHNAVFVAWVTENELGIDRKFAESVYKFFYKPPHNHTKWYVNVPEKQAPWEAVGKSFREHHPAFVEGW